MDMKVAAVITMDIPPHVNLGITCQIWIPLLITVHQTSPMVTCVLVVGRVIIAVLLLSLVTRKHVHTRTHVPANTTNAMVVNLTPRVDQYHSTIVHLMGILEVVDLVRSITPVKR
jgi:hypothetical protein